MDHTQSLWNDRDFADLKDTVGQQTQAITRLERDLGTMHTDLVTQSVLLYRILVTLLGILGATVAALLIFALGH